MGNINAKGKKSRELFRYIDGRRYHNDKNSKYFLPNDDEEVDRLQLQHFLYKHIWKGNFSSPMKHLFNKGASALDIGCGPGTWLLDMASTYPKSKFTGIDISPIFPSEIKPTNLTFMTCNLLDGLPFPDDSFDYVHVRFLMTAFTEEDWNTKVISELIRVVKKGGWIEVMDGEVVSDEHYNGEEKYKSEKMRVGIQYHQDKDESENKREIQNLIHNVNLNLGLKPKQDNNKSKFMTVIRAFESTLITNNINPKLKDLLSTLLRKYSEDYKLIKKLSHKKKIILIGNHNHEDSNSENSSSYEDNKDNNNSNTSELLLKDILQYMNSLKPLLAKVLNLNDQNELDLFAEELIKDVYANDYFFCTYRYYFQKA